MLYSYFGKHFGQNQMTIHVCIYLWTLDSIPLIYIFIHLPVSHYFNYYNFVVSFQIENFKSFPKMLNIGSLYEPEILLLAIHTKRIKNRYLNKYIHTNVCINTVYINTKVEKQQWMSINWWIDQQDVAYPCNGLFIQP